MPNMFNTINSPSYIHLKEINVLSKVISNSLSKNSQPVNQYHSAMTTKTTSSGLVCLLHCSFQRHIPTHTAFRHWSTFGGVLWRLWHCLGRRSWSKCGKFKQDAWGHHNFEKNGFLKRPVLTYSSSDLESPFSQ